MGLMDKIRNIFTEEVEEEEEVVKVEQIKKEVRSVPIESPSVEKREKRKEEKKVERKVELDDFEDELELKPIKEEKASPVFFTERDFEDLIEPKRRVDKYESKQERYVEEKKKEEEKPRPYSGNYNNTTIIQKEKVSFKPTPIISPVYGVLDKNYHKEDIVERKDVNYESVDGLSVDSIRNKAYGTLEDEIEEVMVSEPKKRKVVVEEEVDLFDELEEVEEPVKEEKVETKKETKEKKIKEIEEATIDLTQELDNLLMSKEKYSKVKEDTEEDEEKKENVSGSDLFNLIDSMYEEGEED